MTYQILVIVKDTRHLNLILDEVFDNITAPGSTKFWRKSHDGKTEFTFAPIGSALTGCQFDKILVFGFAGIVAEYGSKAVNYSIHLETHLVPGGRVIYL